MLQVQSLQQLKEGAPAAPQIKSTWQGLQLVIREAGPRALFAGLSLNYLKVVPSTAIGFTVYDALKHYLDLPQHL